MSKVIIMTDSNSGITQTQAKEMGVVVLPMPFYINEEMFYEDIDLSHRYGYTLVVYDFNLSIIVL